MNTPFRNGSAPILVSPRLECIVLFRGAEWENGRFVGFRGYWRHTLRRIVPNILNPDEPDTRSLQKKRRRAVLDLTYRESLLCLG